MSRGTPHAVEPKHDNLVGTSEVCAILGVPRSTVARWLANGTLPRPESNLAATPVWKRKDIERFQERRAQTAADKAEALAAS